MANELPDSLVSTEWLATHGNAPDVRIVDASWYLPQQGRDPKLEYDQEHIPSAVLFDIDEIADTNNPLPHMLPTPEKFAARVCKLGLGNDSRIIIYDSAGCMSAARVWWMFRIFGHDKVAILDGGLQKWRQEGRGLDNLPSTPKKCHFSAHLIPTMVRSFDQVFNNLSASMEQVVDPRPEGRFQGTNPEPRQGLRPGHIPGSFNVPFTSLMEAHNKTFKSTEDITAIFHSAGIDLGKPIVTMCGSGVTACVLALALHLIGHRQVAVYDGSWAEWGYRSETPVECSRLL